MKLSTSIVALFLASSVGAFGPATPVLPSVGVTSRAPPSRGQMTMRARDKFRRQTMQKKFKDMQQNPSKAFVVEELLSVQSSQTVGMCNRRLRKDLIKRIKDYAVKYDVSVDSTFGERFNLQAAAVVELPDDPRVAQTVALVDKAAHLLNTKGSAAFPELREEGEFRNGSTYIFVYDTKCNVLFNSASPEKEGHNTDGLVDKNGKKFHNALAEVNPSGWVDYSWPKPGETEPSQKWTRSVRVNIDGVDAVCLSGFYTLPDDPRVAQTVALVDKAANLLNTKGSEAFPELREEGEFRNGSTYIFAYDTKCNVLFNSASPEKEGHNTDGLVDKNGKKFHNALAEVDPAGWVDYSWPKPGETEPSKKWTRSVRVNIDGVDAVCLSGFYL